MRSDAIQLVQLTVLKFNFLFFCRVCIALFKLSSCAEYSKVAATFGVSKTTVHRCLKMFCRAMSNKKHQMIEWFTDEEAARLADITESNYKYPQAIGK